jgi:hypothetical protein
MAKVKQWENEYLPHELLINMSNDIVSLDNHVCRITQGEKRIGCNYQLRAFAI